jgi:hypothetical protein
MPYILIVGIPGGDTMLKSFALTVALGAGAASACTIFSTAVRYDTISPGVVAITYGSEVNPGVRDTVRISRHSEFKAHIQSLVGANALVFIGAIDSMIQTPPGVDTVIPGLTPDLDLSSQFDTMPYNTSLYMRFRIDTLMQGALPGKMFWVRTRYVQTMCDGSYLGFKNRVFLNASDNLMQLSDLKLDASLAMYLYSPPFPSAHWFDGRYLVSPNFPGLRLDITELYPDYPATSVYRRNVPMSPLKLDGKAYRPDGRVAPENPELPRKSPVPVFR